MKVGKTKSKSSVALKKKRKRAPNAADYNEVLSQLGEDVETAMQIGDCSIILMKGGTRQGRPVILQEGMYYRKRETKQFLSDLKEVLESDAEWAEWDLIR